MKESTIYSFKKKSSLRKRKDEESSQEDNGNYHDGDTIILSKPSKSLMTVSSRKEKISLITDAEQSQEAVNTTDIHDKPQEKEQNTTFMNIPEVLNGQSVYRGQKGYKKFHEPIESKKFKPNQSRINAQQNTKNSIRFDYQPHVCKDYKETGYCGFGDSCVFLHDRGDYKMGWELDREWELKQGDLDIDPNKYLVTNDSDQEKHDNFPITCPLCQDEFHQPVKTKCSHYFCEKCALSHYKMTPKCFICQALTYGQFKPAKDLIQKLNDKLAHLEKERKNLERDLEQEISEDDNGS